MRPSTVANRPVCSATPASGCVAAAASTLKITARVGTGDVAGIRRYIKRAPLGEAFVLADRSGVGRARACRRPGVDAPARQTHAVVTAVGGQVAPAEVARRLRPSSATRRGRRFTSHTRPTRSSSQMAYQVGSHSHQ